MFVCVFAVVVYQGLVLLLNPNADGEIDYNAFVKNIMEDGNAPGTWDPFNYHRNIKDPPRGATPTNDEPDKYVLPKSKELFDRMSRNGAVFALLPQVLYYTMMHPANNLDVALCKSPSLALWLT